MPEYTLTDPKTGAQIKATSSKELTADDLARKSAAYFSKPLPDPNATMEGVAPSSPVVEQGKEAASIAGGLIAPSIGAAAGATVLPTLGKIGRIGGAMLGGMGGRVIGGGLIDGRMPTTPEMLLEAGAAAMGEIGASRTVLKTPAEAEEIGNALRKVAGVGDPMTKFTRKGVAATGDVASDMAASRSIFGRDLMSAIPGISKGIVGAERKLYQTFEKLGNEAGVRVRIPSEAQATAAKASIDIGNPADHPDIASAKRFKGILDRIAAFGQSPQGESSLSIREYRKLQREVSHFAPKFKDRMMPGDEEGGLLSVIQGQLSDGLDNAVKGTKAEQALFNAKEYHKNVKVPFRENVLKTLKGNEGNYADVMDMLVIADKPDKLRIAMKHMSPQLQQSLRQSWLNHKVIVKATDQNGTFNASTALGELQKLSPETRNALFGGAGADVEKIMTRMDQAIAHEKGYLGQAKQMAHRYGPGGVATGLGAYALYKGDFPSAAKAMTLGGGALGLSYILSSPRAVRFFARGLELPPGSKIAVRHGAQILAHLPAEVISALSAEPDTPGSQQDILHATQRFKAQQATPAAP